MKKINIVYLSTTGNIKVFLERVQEVSKRDDIELSLIPLKDINTIEKEDFHLFIPTRGFGNIPEEVKPILENYKDQILTISGSGNRNWGKNYCLAVDKIMKQLNIFSLIKIDLSGTQKDVDYFIKSIKTFYAWKKQEKKSHISS